jgi:hypothetical protein
MKQLKEIKHKLKKIEKPHRTRINLTRSLMRYTKKEKKAKSGLCPFSTLAFYQQEKTLALMDFSKIDSFCMFFS